MLKENSEKIHLPGIELLATDLDGTLAVGGVISESDILAARRLKAQGISVLVVTGRNLVSLKKVNQLWKVADEILFSSGSGLLSAPDALPVERARLSSADVNTVTTILTKAGEDYCVLNPVPDNHFFSWKRFRSPGKNPDFDSRMDIYADWSRPDDGSGGAASQVLVILPPGETPSAPLLKALSPWSVFCSSSPIDSRSIWLEIFPPGMNKGTALADWCRTKNIQRSRVMALGNDHNDETMLSWAGSGRVVEGAPEALKKRFQVMPPAGSGGFEAAVEEILGRIQRS
jgi:hydroxymethylpyrimidine pyrophosphatase-like HAD family hydrolase